MSLWAKLKGYSLASYKPSLKSWHVYFFHFISFLGFNIFSTRKYWYEINHKHDKIYYFACLLITFLHALRHKMNIWIYRSVIRPFRASCMQLSPGFLTRVIKKPVSKSHKIIIAASSLDAICYIIIIDDW